jgi:hypothetical protein
MFRQDFTCPALLKDQFRFTRTGLSPALARLSRRFRLCRIDHWPGPRSLATTSGVSVDVLSSGYLDVSVPRVRLPNLCIQFGITLRWGFPIRKFTDQSLLAAPHDLSQRATSFIASQCQGIHQMPLRRLIHSSRSRAGTNPHSANTTNSTIRSPVANPIAGIRQASTFSAKRPHPCKAEPIRSHFTKPFSRCPRTGSPCCLQSQANLQPICCPSWISITTHPTLNANKRRMVEADGIEPTTSCLQSTRSPN